MSTVIIAGSAELLTMLNHLWRVFVSSIPAKGKCKPYTPELYYIVCSMKCKSENTFVTVLIKRSSTKV